VAAGGADSRALAREAGLPGWLLGPAALGPVTL